MSPEMPPEMSPESCQPSWSKPSWTLRALGWITTPLLYVLLIRIVIREIRHPPAYYH